MKRFVFISQFRDNCGYAVAARGYLKALDYYLKLHPQAFGLSVFVIPLETNNSKITEEEERLIEKYEMILDEVDNLTVHNQPQYTVIWHMPPPMMMWKDRKDGGLVWAKAKQLFDKASDNINISVWEATAIPDAWIELFRQYKTSKVITACKWNEEVFKKQLENVATVYRVPHVLDQSERLDVSEISSLESAIAGKFVFLSVGQWQPRKGLKELLTSYYMEFGKQQDVVLLLKTYINIMNGYTVTAKQQQDVIMNEVRRIRDSIYLDDGTVPTAQVVVVTGAIPKAKLNWMYQRCNTFALSTRGEGFCIPLAEAMQFHKSVVVPKEGGHIDLLEDYPNSRIFLTDGTWQPYEGLPGYTCNMDWYLANIKSVRQQLRKAFQFAKDNPTYYGLFEKNSVAAISEKLGEIILNA